MGTGTGGIRVLMVVEQSSATGHRYYAGLFRGLAGAGIRVDLLNLSRSPEFAEAVAPWVDGIRELGLRAYPAAMAAILREVVRGRPTVVHAQEFIAAGFAGAALTLLPDAPPLLYGRHHSRELRGSARLLDGLALRCADVIVCPSEWAREWLRSRHPSVHRRACVIHHGVEVHDPDPPGEDARRTPDPVVACVADAGVAPVAVMVARLRPGKGHDTALEAWSILQGRARPLRLVMVGEGPERSRLEAQVASRDLAGTVFLPGASQRIGALLSRAHLLVAPSPRESFGLAVVEGMAMGTPVVAARAGAVVETMRHGETGLVVPPGDARALADAVEWILDHPEEAAAMGIRGRARYRDRFTPEAMAHRHAALYQRIHREGR